MLQIQRWLSNWFAEWFSPECLPWILKLHSLHSFSHFNWQLNHSFRSSRASWLLNRFGKALYLVGRLAPGLVNARRSRPTNTAFRIRIRIRIVSALISWLLSISHLLSSSRASITSIHSIESIRDVRPFSTSGRLLRRQNAPWEHRGLFVSSSGTRRATMLLDITCKGYLPRKDSRRASPRPRWCRTTSIAPISTDERIRLEHLQPRERRQEARETREKGQSNTIIYTSTDTNKQTAAIAIAIAINWSSHGLRRPHTTTSDPTYFKDRSDVTRYRGHIKTRHHFHIIILPLPRVPQIALLFWIEFECAAHIDDGRWTMDDGTMPY